jgi:PTH1 family peptidyl-tRNA hydrolase
MQGASGAGPDGEGASPTPEPRSEQSPKPGPSGASPYSWVVVGLGNPGEEYGPTRHNVGFHVVDRVAARLDIDIRRTEFRALTARAELGGSMVLLMKPQTFMNLSGRSAAAALQDLGLPPGRLLAVYDDLDLPLGRLRLRTGGGAGGHRGVASLIAELGTQDFPRVRIGIGRPAEGRAVVEHVLSPFEAAEAGNAREAVERGALAVEAIVRGGLASAMETFNRAGEP